jgi:hypothetical protein
MVKYIGIKKAVGGEPYYFLADGIKFVEQVTSSQVKAHFHSGSSTNDTITITVTNGPTDFTTLRTSFISELARIGNLKDGNFQNMNLTFGAGESFAVSGFVVN